MTVNPNRPTLVGFEPMILRQRGRRVTPNRRQAAVLTPGAILTDDLAVYVRNVVGGPTVAAEIYPLTAVVPGADVQTTDTFVPTADAGMANVQHQNTANTTPPFYTEIDDGVGVANAVDFISNYLSASGSMAFTCSTGAYSAAKRVVSLTLHAYVRARTGVATFTPFITATGGQVNGTTHSIDPALGVTLFEDSGMTFTVNANGSPLTTADIQGLSVGLSFGAAAATDAFEVISMWISVVSVPETRLALGTVTAPVADGWVTVPMATTGGGDTWTPTAATAYVVVLSTPAGSYSWASIDAGTQHPDVYSAEVTLAVDGLPIGLGTLDTAAPAVVGIDGAGVGLWGQPYTSIVEEEVYSGKTVRQQMTLPDANDRGWVKLIIWQASNIAPPSLTVRLKRQSDNVQIGGDVTITPNEVRGAPRLPQVVTIPLAAVASGLTAVQFYLEISSAATQGSGWKVITLSTSALYANLGFGGTTDTAVVGGATVTDRDVPIVLGRARTGPTALAAVAAA